jgi:aryl-alcohol dehydrogenase-like predicted oxidoreductase
MNTPAAANNRWKDNKVDLTSYVTLGRSGLRVSPLCLGTMTFGTETGWGMDQQGSRLVFDHYINEGGNFLDCANSYAGGTSERLLGEFVKDSGSRERLVIATKFTRSIEPGNPNAVGNGRKTILRSLDESLKRLQIDYVDLYWLHSWDMVTPAEEVVSTLDQLVKSGKILHYGFSDVPAWYVARAQTIAEKEGLEPIIALQLEYSLVERSIEREHITVAQELGMALCSWGATASGFLSGKYQQGDGSVVGTGRLSAGGPQMARFSSGNWEILDAVSSVAKELGKTPAQIALNWVATQPGSTSPIVGARTVEQLRENLAVLGFSIPPELRARLDEASAKPLVHPYNMYRPPLSGVLAGGVTVQPWRRVHPYSD